MAPVLISVALALKLVVGENYDRIEDDESKRRWIHKCVSDFPALFSVLSMYSSSDGVKIRRII